MTAAFVSQPAPGGAPPNWRVPHASPHVHNQLGCPRCLSRPTSTAGCAVLDTASRTSSTGSSDDGFFLPDTSRRSSASSPSPDDGVQGAARRQVQDFFVDFSTTTCLGDGRPTKDHRSRRFVSKVKQMPGYDWKGVLRELEHIEHASKVDASVDSVSLAAYAVVLCHIAKCARWKEALEILERIRGARATPDEACVGAALRACNQAGQWQRTLQLLSKARCWGTELSVASYNAGIRACRGLGQWEESVALLRKMPASGVTSDVLSYNSAISACAKGCQGKEAVSLLREMATMSATGAVVPDVTTYSLTIAACGKEGRWEEAVALLQEMPTVGVVPSVLSYSSAISACTKGGQWEQATSLLKEMSAAGLVPDEMAFSSAISACGKAGQWGQAVALLREMPAVGVAPGLASYNAAIVACVKGGQWEQAVALVREMPTAGVVPDALSYGSAISACEDRGQHECALALRREMLEVGISASNIRAACAATEIYRHGGRREGGGVGPSAEISTAGIVGTGIGNGFMQKGTKEMAGSVARHQVVTSKRGDGHQRDHPVALLLLRDMPSLGVKPTATAYEAAIRACRESGHWQEAVALLRMMSEAGIPPGVASYSAAIAACLASGEEQEAVSLFRQMSAADKATLLSREDRELSGLVVALGRGRPTLQMSTRPSGPRLGGQLFGQESTSVVRDYVSGASSPPTIVSSTQLYKRETGRIGCAPTTLR